MERVQTVGLTPKGYIVGNLRILLGEGRIDILQALSMAYEAGKRETASGFDLQDSIEPPFENG